ncbi:MAG: hypothetical protein K8T89_00170 [Planctomycetes bacterium]|nr:hypothetical protein [Planctomycetota bacterium]
MRNYLFIAAILVSSPLFAQDLNKPDTISPEAAAELKLAGTRPPVLVYYANETPATDNLKRLAGWLDKSDDPAAKKLGDRLLSDTKTFVATVDAEVEAIRAAAVADAKPFAVAVFTNALAVKGEFLYLPAGAEGGKYRTGKLALPRFASPVLAANPLATPQGLAAALVAVRGVFPADKHTYLLVTKSHGNGTEVLTPMLTRHYEPADQAKVLATVTADLKRRANARAAWAKVIAALDKDQTLDKDQLLDKDNGLNPFLGNNKDETPTLLADKEMGLAAPESSAVSVVEDTGAASLPLTATDGLLLDLVGPKLIADAVAVAKGTPRAVGREYAGVPKAVYLSVIRAAGEELGMKFPVVFAESCKSEVPKAMLAWLREKPNVGLLYTSDMDGLKYTTIDYAKLFAAGKGTPAERLNAALIAKYEADKAAREKSGKK